MWEDVHEAIDQGLIRDAIAEILIQLTDRQRTVIIARHEFGMTYKEIGDKYKISPARAGQIESRAMRILRSPRFMKEYKKLGIGWIEDIVLSKQREELREKEKEFADQAAWHKKCVENKIAKEKDRKAKEKLRIIYSDIPRPEAIVIRFKPVAPHSPPHFCHLAYQNGIPYIYVNPTYGTIHRELDPKTYDRWLEYLISKQTRPQQ